MSRYSFFLEGSSPVCYQMELLCKETVTWKAKSIKKSSVRSVRQRHL